jgi:hypothetical protein
MSITIKPVTFEWKTDELDPLYGAVPSSDSEYTFRNTHNPNTIICMAGGAEMLRVSPEGFWVRGVRVQQDDTEAETVYNAFKSWMSWAQLNRDYQ